MPLEVGDFVVDLAAPAEAARRGGALRGTNLLRDDLGVPVMVVNSELEAIACYGVRQPDTIPFPAAKRRQLYSDQATYIAQFEQAARAGEKAGVVLSRDVDAMIEEALSTFNA